MRDEREEEIKQELTDSLRAAGVEVVEHRTCCDSTEEQNHHVTCPLMLSLDASFTQDHQRAIDGQKHHSATALHDRVLKHEFLKGSDKVYTETPQYRGFRS